MDTWTFSTSFLHGLRGFFNRIWFPLYFLIYRMIFSRQWIILFWWYLTPTSLIFAGQRMKTDWGKTWGWTLFRWVSFVLCPAFLMIGNNKEATLRKKNNVFSFFWDCLKSQRWDPRNTRTGSSGKSEWGSRMWFLAAENWSFPQVIQVYGHLSAIPSPRQTLNILPFSSQSSAGQIALQWAPTGGGKQLQEEVNNTSSMQ